MFFMHTSFPLMLKMKNEKAWKSSSLSNDFRIFPQFCRWWHLSNGVKEHVVRRRVKLEVVCLLLNVSYEGASLEVNVLAAMESAVYSWVNSGEILSAKL